MNDKELCEELGIVRVAGYWRRAAYEPWTYVWVRAHYRGHISETKSRDRDQRVRSASHGRE